MKEQLKNQILGGINGRHIYNKNTTQHPLYRKDMFGEKLPTPMLDELDEAADRKIDGGYNIRRSNICNICFTYKSTNGCCNC